MQEQRIQDSINKLRIKKVIKSNYKYTELGRQQK